GDYRSVLNEAAACDAAPAFLVLASTYWRNAWKYQGRAWRHCFWDSGTILANLLAVANAHHLPARALSAFVDSAVNRLLGLDTDREAALAVVPLGGGASPASPPPPITPLGLKTDPNSAFEVDYPLIREAQRASSLGSVDEVQAWREQSRDAAGAAGELLTGEGTIERTILRRGSARRFLPAPIRLEELEAMLAAADAPIDTDFPALTRPYLIVNGVDGLEPGAYRGLRDVINLGSMRLMAGHLALDQRLAADAAVNVYLMAEPEGGERGYRAAQLDGSIRGGRVYLAAYALGLAATGLTFYDDEVSELFETDEQVTFLVAAGHRAPRR
ncbi:MAG: nitroreductase family protein, partial [Chloroflexi bacterium]|nr:nitroreductase family protein [Chloroflexota bacterium]